VPSDVARAKALYCDRACAAAAYKARFAGAQNPRYGERSGEERTCQTCGKRFYLFPSYLARPSRTGAFCSNACKGVLTGERTRGKPKSAEHRAKQRAAMLGRKHPERVRPPVVVTCLECGETTSYSGRARYFAQKRRFCGTDCWYSYVRKHPEANGAFKGGYFPYYGPNWPHQAKLARERDGHTCRVCGVYQFNPRLDVHHRRPRREFGEDYAAMNALDNLISLCKACHTRLERSAPPA
jgi:5-methylcytosine-specific restriction endonuclease McrA